MRRFFDSTKRTAIATSLAGFFMAMATAGQPINDNFANRLTLSGTNLAVSSDLFNATAEADEPLIADISSGQTAWWTWTALSNGIVVIAPSAAGFNPFLTVFTGHELADLTLVASNNFLACYDDVECGCHWRMRGSATLHVAKGQVYQICLDSAIVTDASLQIISTPVPEDPGVTFIGFGPVFTTNVISGGPLRFSLKFTPAPRNDNLQNAIKLTGSRARIAASNNGATPQPGEPAPLGNPGGSSVWYSWTAPATGRVTLSTNNIPPYLPPSSGEGGIGVIDILDGLSSCGNLEDQNPPPVFFPVLAAFTGTNIAALAAADCLPMNLAPYPYAVEFDAVKGRTYDIDFDGNMGTTSNITLYLALTTPAANDNFARRIVLHGINVAATGFNAGAAPEAGAPAIGFGSTGRIAWSSWTAPVSGPVKLDLGGSDYAFPVGVFTGTSLAHLKLAAAGAGGVSFNGVMGQTYQIGIGDAGGLTGEIKFTLQAPVVEAALLGSVQYRFAQGFLLRYEAAPGQVLLLQSRTGRQWVDAATATARQGGVTTFYLQEQPNMADYRAVVVDYLVP
ncbi:MAG TPA: hypothetical protein VGO59_03245 [Verrucomicrobiae bacterium]|jgi:hypothetical protein